MIAKYFVPKIVYPAQQRSCCLLIWANNSHTGQMESALNQFISYVTAANKYSCTCHVHARNTITMYCMHNL
jgi:hypothetical protein